MLPSRALTLLLRPKDAASIKFKCQGAGAHVKQTALKLRSGSGAHRLDGSRICDICKAAERVRCALDQGIDMLLLCQ